VEVTVHRINDSPHGRVQCPICDQTFSQKKQAINHVREHLDANDALAAKNFPRVFIPEEGGEEPIPAAISPPTPSPVSSPTPSPMQEAKRSRVFLPEEELEA
jgi:hypothetical protein